MRSIRDGHRGDGGGGDYHGGVGCCGGACSGDKTTPDSSCYCRGVTKFGLSKSQQNKLKLYSIFVSFAFHHTSTVRYF